MKEDCVCLTLALHSREDGGEGSGRLLVAIFSLNSNKTCKMYLKIKTSLHGTMKKILVGLQILRPPLPFSESLC